MRIIPLSEGSFTVDKTKLFVPYDEDKDQLNQRPTGSLLVEIQPFVVITSRDVILLDTGLGFIQNGKKQLLQNLHQAGIDPSSITKVLLTHLHKDHAGGLAGTTGNDNLGFPGALYYLQERELLIAFEQGLPSFTPGDLTALKNSPRVKLLVNDSGNIDSSISYEVTGAHSPYHQVFWIKENDETIFFGGDDAPQLQQMKHRFVAKYDYNGKKSMELRSKWWTEGKKESWSFLFYHDIKTPVYKQPDGY